MKKKLILGLVASVLALTLAIGGTLMLFTAQSETATNVVTLGNAEIKLQESKVEYVENQTEKAADYKDAVTGDEVIFGETDGIEPGDTIAKRPRVVNTGSIPVYVKVEGALVFKRNEEELSWSEIMAIVRQAVPYTGDGDDDRSDEDVNYAFLNLVLEKNDNWFGAPVTAKTVDSYSVFNGTWYYIDDGELAVLDVDAATPDVFQTVSIPLGLGNLAKDVKISLDLTAYAVQSENNEIELEEGAEQGYDDWVAIFKDLDYTEFTEPEA